MKTPVKKTASAPIAATKTEARPAPPKVGAILVYRVPASIADEMNPKRDSAAHRHAGSKIKAGDTLPLIVTAVRENSFSGQLLLDGNDTCWVKSATMGDDEGQCQPA